MCGINGVIADHDVLADLIHGAQLLEHRGPAAAGLFLYNELERRSTLVKGEGSVETVFRDLLRRGRGLEHRLSRPSGTIGISHVRYETSGIGSDDEAHPFVDEYSGMALCFNGNLTNHEQIREELHAREQELTTPCDAEALLRTLSLWTEHYEAHGQQRPDAVFSAIGEVQQRVQGAFTAAVASKDGLYAFKDKHGFWDALLGRRESAEGTAYMVASESIALESLGFTVEKELARGSAIHISPDLHREERTLHQANALPCAFNKIYLGDPDSAVEGEHLRTYRWRAGLTLARRVAALDPTAIAETDMVVAIPSSPIPGAAAFAKELGLDMSSALTTPRYLVRTFLYGTQAMRDLSTKLKFRLDERAVRDKNVFLIDDSIIRGTVSRRVVGMLRDAGAQHIYFGSLWPVVIESCGKGIDTPKRERLLGAQYGGDVEAMRSHIGVDGLYCNTIDDFRQGVLKGAPACMACTDGSRHAALRYAGTVLPP